MADGEESSDCSSSAAADVRWVRVPSKKKFDEHMELLNSAIRKAEEQLDALKASRPVSFAETLKELKLEKNANIERRKKIDADLQKLNKDITEMMHNISRLESSLHYRSEDKIDEAIRRLEWSLKVQNFKLSQEKKIVAEIDSLRRSKKTLNQYLSMKKDKDTMRDRQRRMREERDYYFHKVTELKQREEKLRSDNSGQRVKSEQLKKEVDRLYESKRQMVAQYKKQKEDFFDDREKRRHESFKKRAEEKQALQTSLRSGREKFRVMKPPSEDNICLCNTLIHYLHRFISGTDLEVTSPGVMVTQPPPSTLPSPSEESASALPTGPAEELEDGQYVLLRKPEDDSYVSCSAKHTARKQRRSRKQSMVKRITHTPEVLTQFSVLNLKAPATVAEILASLEQLRARKLYYENQAEVCSEAELSMTESAQCEVSRQASHTESSDGLTDSRPCDQFMEQLLLSVASHSIGCSCSNTSPQQQHTGCSIEDESSPDSISCSTTCNKDTSDVKSTELSASQSLAASPHSRSWSEEGSRSDESSRLVEQSELEKRLDPTFTGRCGDTEEDLGRIMCLDLSVPVHRLSLCNVNVPDSVPNQQCMTSLSDVNQDCANLDHTSTVITNQEHCNVALSRSAANSDTSSDCYGGVFYANKEQLAAGQPSPPNICSDLVVDVSTDNNCVAKSVARCPLVQTENSSVGCHEGQGHKCEGTVIQAAGVVFPSRASDCDSISNIRNKNSSSTTCKSNITNTSNVTADTSIVPSSLEDFPALTRGGGGRFSDSRGDALAWEAKRDG